MYIYRCICIYICKYIYTYIVNAKSQTPNAQLKDTSEHTPWQHTHMHTHTHAHIHIYIHRHVHTFTHMHTQFGSVEGWPGDVVEAVPAATVYQWYPKAPYHAGFEIYQYSYARTHPTPARRSRRI